MSERDVVDCPYCAEEILRAAVKCKHCGENVRGAQTSAVAGSPPHNGKPASKPKGAGRLLCALLTIVGVGIFVVSGVQLTSAGQTDGSARLFVGAAAFLFAGPIAWAIGDRIRKFVLPDAVFVSGGFGMLVWTKVFWLIGPQLVGIAGTFAVIAVVAFPSSSQPSASSKDSAQSETPPAAVVNDPVKASAATVVPADASESSTVVAPTDEEAGSQGGSPNSSAGEGDAPVEGGPAVDALADREQLQRQADEAQRRQRISEHEDRVRCYAGQAVC